MQHGETWTGGYAGSVVGNPEIGRHFLVLTNFRNDVRVKKSY